MTQSPLSPGPGGDVLLRVAIVSRADCKSVQFHRAAIGSELAEIWQRTGCK